MPTDREVLNTIERGTLSRKRGVDDDFDEVLAIVQDLDRQGYLLGALFHRSNTSKESEIDLVVVHRLSKLGRQKLAEPT